MLGYFTDARNEYVNSTKIKPVHFYDHVNKGLALDDLGMQREAIISYDEALKIVPTDYKTWINKGVAYDKAKGIRERNGMLRQGDRH